jgi:hypothetical protein
MPLLFLCKLKQVKSYKEHICTLRGSYFHFLRMKYKNIQGVFELKKNSNLFQYKQDA